MTEKSDLGLSEKWSAWVLENLMNGASVDEVIQGLCANEVPEALAKKEVNALVGASLRELFMANKQSQVMRRLHRDIEQTSTAIERRKDLSVEDFYASYYSTSTPVIIEDFSEGWPARKWTPDRLVELLGDTNIRYCDKRDSEPDYDMKANHHERESSMREFKERVMTAGESNDFYLVANNRNLEDAALQRLFKEIDLSHTMLLARRLVGGSALWFGPKGTVTPLHHDTSNIMFCQLYGEKRFTIFSPWETELLRDARSMYAGKSVDPEESCERIAALNCREVVLKPGDSLFIPVGWWHHVRSLSVAISLAFTCFTKNNQFSWYRPGEVGMADR